MRSIDYTGAEIAVETNAGTFAAPRVLVTVPLGVLQSGALGFAPALPQEKLGAISRLGMGLLDKVALPFPQSFWPERHILAFITDQPGQWPDVFNMQHVYDQPVLVALRVAAPPGPTSGGPMPSWSPG